MERAVLYVNCDVCRTKSSVSGMVRVALCWNSKRNPSEETKEQEQHLNNTNICVTTANEIKVNIVRVCNASQNVIDFDPKRQHRISIVSISLFQLNR